jgi:predicted nucleic acid-binding protein
MRLPAKVLVVDAAIVVAALLGRSAGVFRRVTQDVSLATTDRALAEATRRVGLGMQRPDLIDTLSNLVAAVEVVPLDFLSHHIPQAQVALRDSIPSRNGSTSDAHILALAWDLEAEIWSHDRDFAGTGVATWSTINLVSGLALARA